MFVFLCCVSFACCTRIITNHLPRSNFASSTLDRPLSRPLRLCRRLIDGERARERTEGRDWQCHECATGDMNSLSSTLTHFPASLVLRPFYSGNEQHWRFVLFFFTFVQQSNFVSKHVFSIWTSILLPNEPECLIVLLSQLSWMLVVELPCVWYHLLLFCMRACWTIRPDFRVRCDATLCCCCLQTNCWQRRRNTRPSAKSSTRRLPNWLAFKHHHHSHTTHRTQSILIAMIFLYTS